MSNWKNPLVSWFIELFPNALRVGMWIHIMHEPDGMMVWAALVSINIIQTRIYEDNQHLIMVYLDAYSRNRAPQLPRYAVIQRQTAVTAAFASKQLRLFAFTRQL